MPCNDAQKQAWQEASKGGKEMQEKLLRKEFADVGWQAPRLLETVGQSPDFYFQAVQQIRMSTWSSSRVVCLGDAAHAPTPLTGMGTSLAIIGAYILAGELSKLGDSEHPSKALQAYDIALRPLVERIQNIPFFVPAIVHPKMAWKRWLLQTAVWAVSKAVAIPWLVSRFESSSKDPFALPQYPNLDNKIA